VGFQPTRLEAYDDRSMPRWLPLLWLLAAGCVPVARTPQAAHARAHGALHPVLLAYLTTFDAWLTEEERARVAAVDLSDTLGGDAQRLRYLAADRVVRTLLPRALEARGGPELLAHAARLRALPPLLNRDTDAVATPVVREAIAALRAGPGARVASARGDARPAEGAEDDALAEASRETVDPEAEAELAEALAEYAEAYARSQGVSRMYADAAAAAASDAVDAGLLFQTAVEVWGVPRAEAVGEATELLADMAAAARRRERIPYIPRADDTTDRVGSALP
jgi:hypothetical protein